MLLFHCIQNDVADFLVPLNLSQYLHLFEAEGYYLKEDVVNLPFLSKEKLVAMGITKRGQYTYMYTNTYILYW